MARPAFTCTIETEPAQRDGLLTNAHVNVLLVYITERATGSNRTAYVLCNAVSTVFSKFSVVCL